MERNEPVESSAFREHNRPAGSRIPGNTLEAMFFKKPGFLA
jgi:hypothetical protein